MTPRPAGPQGRRTAEEARATRARLIELAADLFAERGYVQTSIRDLGRHASVTSGAIYGHFRSKADLLAETIHSRTSELLEAETMGLPGPRDHVETLTRQARRSAKRRGLRALIVQGSAAAQTDDDTRARLRAEQLTHLEAWAAAYERNRDELRIDPALDVETAVLFSWSVELGLGVLEGMGIEPKSSRAWADMHNRMARSWALPPDDVAE